MSAQTVKLSVFDVCVTWVYGWECVLHETFNDEKVNTHIMPWQCELKQQAGPNSLRETKATTTKIQPPFLQVW